MWIIGLLILMIAILVSGSRIYHRRRLERESARLNPIGQLVQVNDHMMSVLVRGNRESSITLVFMAGGGTCSPILDFKSLYTLFEDAYRIAVIERSGYGFSEDGTSSRDVDTVLEESRDALRKAGVTNKLVLLPHSMSGIEAIRWANRYGDEILAIIGLDPAVPDVYINAKLNIAAVRTFKLITDLGLLRLFPSITNHAAAVKSGTLTEEEKELYRLLFLRNTLTGSMFREVAMIKKNAIKVAETDSTTIPMLFFISNGSGTGYKREFWQKCLQDYVRGKGGEAVVLTCSHYVHDIAYAQIFEKSDGFLQAL